MKSILCVLIVVVMCIGLTDNLYSQDNQKHDCIFKSSSLHYSVKGMAYWYDKAQGGLETVSGVPYDDLSCKNCHISSCDVCHKEEKNGKVIYSNEAAKNQNICLKCHARESSMMNIDKKLNTPDVHFSAGMECVDCHTPREMHGDGIEYYSMKQPGAMDVSCEQCHEKISKSRSHIIHGKNVDCKACHVQHVVSCTNCHFETMVKEGKRVAVPVSEWMFLVNSNGKVTSANFQTFVMPGKKTFLMFAPQFSHSVSKEGKKCEDCHANSNVKNASNGEINLTWIENNKVEQTKGVIPVVDGVEYNMIYQDYKEGKWTPIENPVKPKIQYVGFGTPLTKEQLKKLMKTQKTKSGNE